MNCAFGCLFPSRPAASPTASACQQLICGRLNLAMAAFFAAAFNALAPAPTGGRPLVELTSSSSHATAAVGEPLAPASPLQIQATTDEQRTRLERWRTLAQDAERQLAIMLGGKSNLTVLPLRDMAATWPGGAPPSTCPLVRPTRLAGRGRSWALQMRTIRPHRLATSSRGGENGAGSWRSASTRNACRDGARGRPCCEAQADGSHP